MCDLVLDDTFSLAQSDGDWSIYPIGEGFDQGNPEPFERTVETFLRLGSVALIEGWSNRQWSVRVAVEGETSAARAQAAAKLHKALARPTKLTVTPCDGWGEPTWFHVWTARLDHETDDLAAVLNKREIYVVHLTLGPFGMGETPFSVEAIPGSYSAATVWDGATDPITGWTATSGTLTDAGTYMTVTGTTLVEQVQNLTFGLNAVQPALLTVLMDRNGYVDKAWLYDADAAAWVESSSAAYPSGTSGSDAYYFSFPAGNYTGVRIGNLAASKAGDMSVYKVTLSDNLDGGRSFFLDVPGSAPTSVSLSTSATSALAIHTVPAVAEVAGWSPELTPFNEETHVETGGTRTYTASNLPEGTYDLVAHLGPQLAAPSAILDISWDVNGTGTVPSTTALQGGRMLLDTDAAGYSGSLHPTVIARGITVPDGQTSMTVRISLKSTVTPFEARIRFVWLMFTGNPLTGLRGDYTLISGATSGVVEIDAPTPTRPRPRLLVGGAHDGRWVKAWGDHDCFPGTTRLYAATIGTTLDAPTVTVTGYPAYQTYAVPDDRDV